MAGLADLDRARATAAQPFSATYRSVGDEPMIIDLPIPPAGPNATQHTMIWGVSFVATLALRAPDTRGTPPNSGLFLCPPGTPPETLAQAQVGVNVYARPFPIPLNDPYLNVALVGVTWSVQMVSMLGFMGVLPQGWFVRAILNCQQGAATPGPGLNSFGILTALVTLEGNQDMSLCL